MSYVDVLQGTYTYRECDYTQVFYQKGKVRPLALLKKHRKYLDAFSSRWDTKLKKSFIRSIEELACALYGYSRMTNIHQLIKCEFAKSKSKPNWNHLDRIKLVDSTIFPVNYNTFHEQIKQAWYIALICKTATDPHASFENDSIDYSYQMSYSQSSLEMKWFHGDQHYVKSVLIRSFSGPYFPAFGLNTERYSVSLRTQSECGKIWT